jgi:hypothetical protein
LSYSTASFIYNQWNGLAYYSFVKKLAESKSDTWMDSLAPLAKQILSSGKPHLILACEKTQADTLRSHHFYKLGDRPVAPAKTPWKGHYKPHPIPSQARLISAPVSFTALGLRTASYRDPDVAELMISTELLENVFLHKEVREKGGAYGGGASYAPTTGNYHLYAFRDPHLAQTIATFHTSLKRLANGEFNERELEEAKLGLIAAIDTPVPPSGRALVSYAWLRSGRTLEERQKLRDQILAATKSQIMAAVSRSLLDHPSTVVALLGSQLWKKEEKKLQQALKLVPLT